MNDFDIIILESGIKLKIFRDEDYLSFEDAKANCDSSIESYRLPTKSELKEMFQHKDKILYFATGYTSYWSNELDFKGNPTFLIGTGDFGISTSENEKCHTRYVKTM
jgi:hypothetical protein